jgi:hypothetical protein
MPLTSSIDDMFEGASGQPPAAGASADDQGIRTGRYIVVFKDNATDATVDHFQSTYNLAATSAASFDGQSVAFEDLGQAEVLIFPEIGAL